MACKYLWDEDKAVLKGNFRALKAYVKNEEFKINNLSFYLKVEKEGLN